MKDFNKVWKDLAHKKQNTRVNHLIFCILKAINSKTNKDKTKIALAMIREAFTPASNENKLNNGWHRYKAVELAREYLYESPEHFQKLMGCLESEWESEMFYSVLGNLQTQEVVINRTECLSTYSVENLEAPYSYIFVNEYLWPEDQLVQSAHVAIELGYNLPKELVDDLHLVVIATPPEEFNAVIKSCSENGIKFSTFGERKFGKDFTALATHPLKGRKREIFKGYSVLTYIF